METITSETTSSSSTHADTGEADWLLARAGFYWRTRDIGANKTVRALICAPLEQAGLTNGFSTRAGGASPMPHDALNLAGFQDDEAANIYENRRRFLKLFAGPWTLATCWQVHGAQVRVVRTENDAENADTVHCDALTTDRPGVLIGVKTADCVPVLLGDERTKAVAAVHAGWRGTVASACVRALETMRKEYGTRSKDVRVAIGPAAAACCYEVGPEVIEAFGVAFPQTNDNLLAPTRAGYALIDLPKANAGQLIEVGVDPANIHVAPLCTMCRTDLFFSYRREKLQYGRTGRLLAVIGHAATNSAR